MSERNIQGRLIEYLRPYMWPHFAAAIGCMVLYSASSGAVPYLVRTLVDDVLERGDREMLRYVPFLIIATFVVRGLVNFGQAYLGEYVGQHIVFDVRRDLDSKVQHLPVSVFDRMASGTILSRVTTDVLLVRQALTEGAAAMIRDATTVLVLILVAFYLDGELALLAFLAFPAIVLPLQKLSKKMRRLSRRGLDSLGNLSVLLQETILGNRVVKAFGMEEYEKRRFDEEGRRLLRTYMRAAKIKAFTTPLMEVLAAVGVAAVLWFGGISVMSGGRTTGSFIAFLSTLVLFPYRSLDLVSLRPKFLSSRHYYHGSQKGRNAEPHAATCFSVGIPPFLLSGIPFWATLAVDGQSVA